jgi:hypothetical protein
MYCTKCNHHLGECTCPDLAERLERLVKSDHIYIEAAALKRYEAQAKKNKEQTSKAE